MQTIDCRFQKIVIHAHCEGLHICQTSVAMRTEKVKIPSGLVVLKPPRPVGEAVALEVDLPVDPRAHLVAQNFE